MHEPTGVAANAATILFNLPDYPVISTTVSAGRRQVIIENDQPPGCPNCGVISSRRKERRFQRHNDITVAGPVEVLWSKYRWYCEEPACDRLSFIESTPQVPPRACSTTRLRLRDQLLVAVIRSGGAVSEMAAGFAVSWWMVRAALNEACLLRLPDVDKLNPGCWASTSTGSGPCATSKTDIEGMGSVRALDDNHRGPGHRPGPGRR